MTRHFNRSVFGAVFAAVLAAAGLMLQAEPQQPVGTWASTSTALDAGGGAASVALADGRTLIASGDRVVIYDPVANTVTAAGQLIANRVGHSATLLEDGTVLVAGGTVDGSPSADLEVFDPASGGSSLVGNMAQPRSGHAAARLAGGKVLIAGGASLDGAIVGTAELFDPATGGTTVLGTALSQPRAGASATALIDGRVLVAGGSDGASDLATAEIFDPYFTTFSTVDTRLSVARSGHTAVLLPHNNSVLVAGGTAAGQPVNVADLFLPAEFPDPYSYGAGSFAAAASMAAARSGAVGGPGHADGYAFVAGGGAADAERYRFATIKTDKDDYTPGERAVITGSGWQPGEAVRLLFQEDPAVHDDYVLEVTADSEGNIYWDQWAPEEHDLNVRFYLMASDSRSRAQTTFTDARVVTSVKLTHGPTTITCEPAASPCTGNLTVQAGATISAEITVTTDGGSTNAFAWESTGWRVSSTAPGAVTCVNTPDRTSPGTFTANFVITAPATTGTFNAYFIAYRDGACGMGASNTLLFPNSVTVAPPNSSPTGITDADPAANEVNENATNGTTVGVTALGADPDAGDTLTYSLTDAAGGRFEINPTTGVVTVANGTLLDYETATSHSVTVKVTDSGGLFTTQAFTIDVLNANEAPSGISDSDPATNAVNENAPNGTTVGVTALAADPDTGDTFTYSLTDNAGGRFAINGSTGVVTVVDGTLLDYEAASSHGITVKATDAGGLFTTQAFTIGVLNVNEAPVLDSIGNKAVNEEVTLQFTASATDPDGSADTLTFGLIDAPLGASITAGGQFSWTPTEADGPGSYTFTVRVMDDGSPSLSDEEEITVTVNEVNVAPVLAAIPAQTVDELTELTFTASATDADVPVNTLTFSLIGAPAGASIDANGNFSWTPAEEQGPGSYTFTVRVTDDGTPNLLDDEVVSVTVNEVNVAPALAAIGNKTVNELAPLTFTASATDADVPANALTFSLIGAPSGAAIDATGNFTWTPAEDQGPGNYTFTVKVTDDGTPSLSDEEEVTVTVNEVNVAPVLATIGDRTVNELEELAFTAAATDADVPANTLTFSLVGAPPGAVINSNTGAFTWTPTEAQGPGSYTFTVRVSDDGSPSLYDEEQITVTVNEVNAAPVLAAIGNKMVDELTLLSFMVNATDPDLPPNTLIFSLGPGAPAGASMTPSGQFTWTPTEAQGPGVYMVTVQVTDNGSPVLSDAEVITITVNEVNLAPVLAPIGSKSVVLGNTLAFTATATDADLPPNALSYSLGPGAPAGASINSGTGAFSWTPTPAQAGVHSVTIVVTDNGSPLLGDSETITVTVQYGVCTLYDTTRSHKKGSTVPIKLYLCDATGNNVSSPGVVVHATGLSKLDGTPSPYLAEDSGNANPDSNFRFDLALTSGGGYIFNLSTKGYTTGTWLLNFTVNGVVDPTYVARFDLK